MYIHICTHFKIGLFFPTCWVLRVICIFWIPVHSIILEAQCTNCVQLWSLGLACHQGYLLPAHHSPFLPGYHRQICTGLQSQHGSGSQSLRAGERDPEVSRSGRLPVPPGHHSPRFAVVLRLPCYDQSLRAGRVQRWSLHLMETGRAVVPVIMLMATDLLLYRICFTNIFFRSVIWLFFLSIVFL